MSASGRTRVSLKGVIKVVPAQRRQGYPKSDGARRIANKDKNASRAICSPQRAGAASSKNNVQTSLPEPGDGCGVTRFILPSRIWGLWADEPHEHSDEHSMMFHSSALCIRADALRFHCEQTSCRSLLLAATSSWLTGRLMAAQLSSWALTE